VPKPDREPPEEPTGIPRLDALREARRDLRFKLNVDVQIDSPSKGSVLGRTLDLSDHGISATLRARGRLQFVEPNSVLHLIRENCCLLERTDTDTF
jgi:hypothetical protein